MEDGQVSMFGMDGEWKEGLEIKLASLHCGIVWGFAAGSRALWISSVMS